MKQRKFEAGEEVRCEPRGIVLLALDCIDAFVEANATNRTRSRCFRCPTGKRRRTKFAGEFAEGGPE